MDTPMDTPALRASPPLVAALCRQHLLTRGKDGAIEPAQLHLQVHAVTTDSAITTCPTPSSGLPATSAIWTPTIALLVTSSRETSRLVSVCPPPRPEFSHAGRPVRAD